MQIVQSKTTTGIETKVLCAPWMSLVRAANGALPLALLGQENTEKTFAEGGYIMTRCSQGHADLIWQENV